MKLRLPSNLYEKNDYAPALEAIYDLAMLAVIRHKYHQQDAVWRFKSTGYFEHEFQQMLKASKLVRHAVLESHTYPKGFR